jgi:hypothetical protein
VTGQRRLGTPARAAILLAVVLALAGCGAAAPREPPPDLGGRGASWRLSVRGMTYVGYDAGVFCTAASDRRLAQLPALHVNTLALVPVWYQATATSTAIGPWPGVSPTDACVLHAMAVARRLGLRVILKPFVDVRDGTWRALIRPTDWTAWFASYRAFVVHYGRLAARGGAWALVVGTEMSSSDVTQPDAWRAVIAAARRVFPGPLTYAADWPQYRAIAFWDRLDWVGVDAYFPLAPGPRPSLADLLAAWQPWLQQIGSWYAGAGGGKPVLLTEIGYRSETGATADPAVWSRGAAPDPGLQADAFRAAFRALTPQPWLVGTLWFWWDNPSTADRGGGPRDRGYTPRGKPAAAVLARWYGRWEAAR